MTYLSSKMNASVIPDPPEYFVVTSTNDMWSRSLMVYQGVRHI